MAACPTCKGPIEAHSRPYVPFCSKRCKLIDLGQWLDEGYRIPDGAPPAPVPRSRTHGKPS